MASNLEQSIAMAEMHEARGELSEARDWRRCAAEAAATIAFGEAMDLSNLGREERQALWSLFRGAVLALSGQASPWDLIENATKVAKSCAIALAEGAE